MHTAITFLYLLSSKHSSPFCVLSRQISLVYNHTYGDLMSILCSSHSGHLLHVNPTVGPFNSDSDNLFEVKYWFY